MINEGIYRCFGKKRYNNTITDIINNITNSIIHELTDNTSGMISTAFVVEHHYSVANNYTSSRLVLDGSPIYNINITKDRITIKGIHSGSLYNNTFVYAFSDYYKIQNRLFYKKITFNKGNSVSNFVNDIRNNIMRECVDNIPNIDIECNTEENKVEIVHRRRIDTNKVDYDFLKYKLASGEIFDNSNESFNTIYYYVRKNTIITNRITYSEFNAILVELQNDTTSSIEYLYSEYNNIKNTIGGAVLYITKGNIVKTILCHKSLMPSIHSGFITYRSAYEEKLVNLKTDNFDSIIIKDLDFSNINGQVLLG